MEVVEYNGIVDAWAVVGVLCGDVSGGAVGDGVCVGVLVAAECGAGVL